MQSNIGPVQTEKRKQTGKNPKKSCKVDILYVRPSYSLSDLIRDNGIELPESPRKIFRLDFLSLHLHRRTALGPTQYLTPIYHMRHHQPVALTTYFARTYIFTLFFFHEQWKNGTSENTMFKDSCCFPCLICIVWVCKRLLVCRILSFFISLWLECLNMFFLLVSCPPAWTCEGPQNVTNEINEVKWTCVTSAVYAFLWKCRALDGLLIFANIYSYFQRSFNF